MSCTGIAIDTIVGLGATYFESSSEKCDHSNDQVHQSLSQSSPYESEDDIKTAIWQTLVGNRTPTGKIAPPEYKSLLQCGLTIPGDTRTEIDHWRGRTTFNNLMESNRHLQLGGKPLGSYFPRSDNGGPDPSSSRDALERMFRFWRTRRPIVSSTGHFGAAPAATRPNDQIFVLFGCTAPVVLRRTKTSRQFQLVGCCYLQGFMEGEAVRQVLNRLRQISEVVIS